MDSFRRREMGFRFAGVCYRPRLLALAGGGYQEGKELRVFGVRE